ncbi:hypothetical protein [Bailinhaonella thermotolerans]|uniref:Uncharacterized protein n=1 Tax=Bailinhaonella thermotolerans TaxID=1070861 RepID=A0A3A4BCE6_9ACTN|nr:hypothetical protein [Bailinhaonella thermotolerans]RJL31868.1 hypothetical protein D5H75_15505 [Bailinhaonella thermotolerans]
MRRLNSTVVVVVGERAAEVVGSLGSLHNVRAVVRGDRDPAEVTEVVRRSGAMYVVHDADPLAEVARTWEAFFDGDEPTGGLEVAIERALSDLRADRAILPDYYVVLDPEDLPPTRRHWWMGVMAAAAPVRVVPAKASAPDVAEALSGLSAGRWWPQDLASWLRALPRTVPDQPLLT